MPDYASNSNKAKTEVEKKKPKDKPKPTAIVTEGVVKKEKSFGQKFKSVFFGGSFKTAAAFVAADVSLLRS